MQPQIPAWAPYVAIPALLVVVGYFTRLIVKMVEAGEGPPGGFGLRKGDLIFGYLWVVYAVFIKLPIRLIAYVAQRLGSAQNQRVLILGLILVPAVAYLLFVLATSFK